MTTPQASPKRSPRRLSPKGSPKRKALHERSKSQSNKDSLRLVKDDRNAEKSIYSSTPFPTKPAHVLRPVPLWGQGSPQAEGGSVSGDELPDRLLQHINKNKGKGRAFSNASSRPSTADARSLSLKRSVRALRQQFEDQANISQAISQASTPTGLLSPQLGPEIYRDIPSSFGSLSISASEEAFHLSSPEPAHFLLSHHKSEDSLPPIVASPRESYESRRGCDHRPTTPGLSADQDSSSPNVIRLGGPSSPNPNPFEAFSSPYTRSELGESSSPNVVRLGDPSSPNPERYDRFSRTKQELPLDDPSSPAAIRVERAERSIPQLVDVSSRSSTPNLIQLEESSPNIVRIGPLSSPAAYKPKTADSDESEDSAGTVRRRHEAREQTSYSTFPNSATRFSSSPPEQHLNTYPSASSLYLSDSGNDSAPTASGSQEELQSIVPSSPVSIQYPVVHAPAASTYYQISVPKRESQPGMLSEPPGGWSPHHLSMIPSEYSAERQYSVQPSTEDEFLADLPRPQYPRNVTGSTIRRVTEDDYNEASDNLSELRTSSLRGKGSGFLTLISSNSDSRRSSLRESIRRQGSQGSLRSSLPGWARRYYSMGGSQLAVNLWGGRRDSVNSARGGYIPTHYPFDISRPDTSSDSPTYDNMPTSIFRPRTRLRTRSSTEPALGPLTSHPTPEEENSPEVFRRESRQARDRRARPKSLPLDPIDPRSHWAGAEQAAVERDLQELESQLRQSRLAYEWSPHLFQDVRVEKSGKGRRNKWKAPSLENGGTNSSIFERRNIQVWGFAFGFIFPICWFIVSFWPLPIKPTGYTIEEPTGTNGKQRRSVASPTRRPSNFRMSRQDLEAQIRLEQKIATAQEIRYENARWWRNINRVMSLIGIVLIALVTSLAILGTRNGGF